MNINKNRSTSYYIVSIFFLLTLMFCCSCEKKPSGSDPQVQLISDECDNPQNLDFYITETALIPIPKSDLTFETIGQTGAEAIVEELMSADGICSLDISTSAQTIFTQVEQLISETNYEAALNLLSTISYTVDQRQKVRDLIQAAAYHILAGGDGVDYMDNAKSVYSTWATTEIPGATVEEALRMAAEAQLLKITDLDIWALNKAQEFVTNVLSVAISNFDPCVATVADVIELLNEFARVVLVGADEISSEVAVMELAGQVMLRIGANAETTRQVFGESILEPDCGGAGTGFIFNWSRIVSDGLIFTGHGSSCDGLGWTGTVLLSGVNESGASVTSSGSFSFSIPGGTIMVQTIVETSGTMTVGGEVLSFVDPLPMTFEFMESSMQANITIASDGSGLLNTPIGPIIFASVFTTDPSFVVVLSDNPNCK